VHVAAVADLAHGERADHHHLTAEGEPGQATDRVHLQRAVEQLAAERTGLIHVGRA
jgi:hypothetical protein